MRMEIEWIIGKKSKNDRIYLITTEPKEPITIFRLGLLVNQFHEFILFAVKGKRRLNYEDKPPCNILNFTRVLHDRKHPTEKPVELLKALISWSTVEGETVLDPFCGSGSTLVAAEELGRNWIGIEKDPHWYDVARARIAELRKRKEVVEND